MGSRIALVSLAAIALIFGGCCGPQKYKLVGERVEMYGLTLNVSQRRGDYRLVLVTPTGGWSVEKDAERREEGVPTIYLTVSPPAPDTIVTQQLVEHPIRTRAHACGPMNVLIREAPAMEKTGEAEFGGYRDVPLRR